MEHIDIDVTVLELEPVDVMCTASENGVAGARPAFERLESSLASLRGRRFYGVLHPDGTYVACVARRSDDDAEALGLSTWTIPGGAYARARLREWQRSVADIGPTFAAIAARHTEDDQRPSIEYYRSRSELDLLLPITAEAPE